MMYLNIKGRIFSGFALIASVGLVVAFYGVRQLGHVGEQADKMSSLSANVARVLQASNDLEATRGAENRFLTNGEPAEMQEAQHRLDEVGILLNAISETVSDEKRKICSGLQEAVRAHKATIEQVTSLTQDARTGKAQLIIGGDGLTSVSNKLVEAAGTGDERLRSLAADVASAISLMRVATWRTLAINEAAGRPAFENSHQAALAALGQASGGVTDKLRDSVSTRLAAYSASFDTYWDVRAKLDEVSDGQMRIEIKSMQWTLKGISDSLEADFGAANIAGQSLVVATSFNEKICAAGALVAGIVLAFLIGRGISGPITNMTAAMLRLADGDLETSVPGVDRRDELGDMSQAMHVFRQNAIKARDLEKQAAARAADDERIRVEAERAETADLLRTNDLQRQAAEASARLAAENERIRFEAERAAAAAAAEIVVGSIGEGLARLAKGDLTFRLDSELPPVYEKLRTDLNAATEHLQVAMGGVVDNTFALRAGAGEVAKAADDLSRRTEQQAASLEQTAAALEEITSAVRKTAEGSMRARLTISQIKEDAEKSGKVVQHAVGAMDEIESSSKEISHIIGVIDEIAFQTNLLALNAGVEAARAGDAGRGFAVVASEVRALAQRSATAAKEIKTLISSSAKQVHSGVKFVGEAGQSLDHIIMQISEITDTVSEIAKAAEKQASGLQEVNIGINHMDQVTQQNAAMVEQSTAACHSLAQQTDELAALTAQFRISQEQADRASSPTDATVQKSSRLVSNDKRPSIDTRRKGGRGGLLTLVPMAAAENWTEF